MAGYAVLALTYVMSQFFRAFLAVLTPVLTSELAMTKTELGVASGIFFVTFALMQFKVGLMLDRRGSRYTAGLIFPLFAGGGALLFALAQNSLMVIAAMGLIGIGCSPVLMASYYLFARHGAPERFALFTTWFVAFGTLGNVAGTSPLAYAVETFGWRETIAFLGLVSVVLGLLLWRFVRPQAVVEAGVGGGYSGYFKLLKMRWFWPLIPLMLIAYMPPAGIRGLWAGPYLTETFGASAIQIGNVTFFMALGMALGSFIYGPLEKLTGSARNLILGGNLVQLAILIWLALYSPVTLFGTGILFAAIGFFGMTYGLQMAHGRSFLPPDLLGRGVTLMNFFNIAGVGIMQIAGGPILETAKSVSPNGAFQGLFLVYAFAVGISCVAFLFAKGKPVH